MKIRIQNDGKPSYMTQLTNAETGEPIEHATRVDVNLVIDVKEQVPTATITTLFPVVDVVAEVTETREYCPCCGKLTSDVVPTISTVQAVKDENAATRDDELSRLVFTALGEASMAWEKEADGIVFDSVKVKQIGNDLLEVLKTFM